MGCGKSGSGRKLARELSFEFADMDADIEAAEGMRVADIFQTHGEPYFRRCERRVLEGYLERDNLVVATGGGVPCHGDNMDLMNRGGVTIYMKMSPAKLVARLQGEGRAKRPLIAGMDDEALLLYIEAHLPQREAYYAKSHLTIDCDGCSDGYVVEHAARYIKMEKTGLL